MAGAFSDGAIPTPLVCSHNSGHSHHGRWTARPDVSRAPRVVGRPPIVEEVTHRRQYEGRLMGFNNLPETALFSSACYPTAHVRPARYRLPFILSVTWSYSTSNLSGAGVETRYIGIFGRVWPVTHRPAWIS
jgi:hypothetical protein